MGESKLLLPWGNGRLLDAVLRAWTVSHVTATVVTVRRDDRQLVETCRGSGVELVQLDFPPPDMKASIAAALAYIGRKWRPAPQDAWLVAPADLPGLSAVAIDRLLEAYDPASPSVLAPRYDTGRGHPVLLPWALAGDVPQLAAGEGIRDLIARQRVKEIDLRELPKPKDIDTPEDYRRALDNRGGP